MEFCKSLEIWGGKVGWDLFFVYANKGCVGRSLTVTRPLS